MNSKLTSNYLRSSPIIDWDDPEVSKKAASLAANKTSDVDIARQCFEFVRDEIHHSKDFEMNPITLKASDVLKYKTGFCFAKSHFWLHCSELMAFLRACAISGSCWKGPDNGSTCMD